MVWPRRFQDLQKELFPTQRSAIVARLNEEHERVLYVQASTLRGLSSTTNQYTILIGDGLFSRIVYNKDDHIADYNGEIISVEEADIRDELGHGGYMLYVNETTRMDCFLNCLNYKCKASKANSNTRAFNTSTGRAAIPNSRMIWSTHEIRIRLVATRYIPMHSEIITNYGSGFRYPTPSEGNEQVHA